MPAPLGKTLTLPTWLREEDTHLDHLGDLGDRPTAWASPRSGPFVLDAVLSPPYVPPMRERDLKRLVRASMRQLGFRNGWVFLEFKWGGAALKAHYRRAIEVWRLAKRPRRAVRPFPCASLR